jgi:hypothetical protein
MVGVQFQYSFRHSKLDTATFIPVTGQPKNIESKHSDNITPDLAPVLAWFVTVMEIDVSDRARRLIRSSILEIQKNQEYGKK